MVQKSKLRAELGVAWVCLMVGCTAASDELPAPRLETIEHEIVGGTPAPSGQFPGFASLRDDEGRHICGGTLIAPSWVLTAGHCLYTDQVRGGVEVVVVGGSTLSANDGEHLTVERAYQHPDYNEDVLFPEHDVGLLRLATPSSATPVRLAGQDVLRHLHPGTMLRVPGFGATHEDADEASDALLFADVPLVSRRECARVYGNFLFDSMFCAGYPKGGIDSCYGDSGGPVFASDAHGAVQLAVVTGGIGCARPQWYGLYTHVPRYQAWITSTRTQGDLEAPVLAPCFARCAADHACVAGEPPWSCSSAREACLCACGGETTVLCEGGVDEDDVTSGGGESTVPSEDDVAPSAQGSADAPGASEVL